MLADKQLLPSVHAVLQPSNHGTADLRDPSGPAGLRQLADSRALVPVTSPLTHGGS